MPPLLSPPWEFLHHASETSLRCYELSRLNLAANLRKEIAALLDQWLEETASSMLARWLLEHRELLRELSAPDAAPPAPKTDLLSGASAFGPPSEPDIPAP